MTIDENIVIKRIETKVLNGRKINVKITLEIGVKVYCNDTIDFISNMNCMEDIQVLNNEREINSLVGNGMTKVYAKDTVTVDTQDEIAEIMKINTKIINRDIKLSYNKVLAKADADIDIMYLTEDNIIRNIKAQIPVMGFIDIENIADDNICDVDYKIKNMIAKPNNSDSHSIYIEEEIEIMCFAYETKSINIIEDMYSISSNLNFTQKEIQTVCDKNNFKENCNVKEQISIGEIQVENICNADIIPTIVNMNVRNGKIIYEGELNIEFLYNSNNGLNFTSNKIPFNFEVVSENVNENNKISTNIDIAKCAFDVNGTTMDINVELEFNISSSKDEIINIIEEISLEENKDNNIYSMIIYFVKPGDTLWKIAKNFKSTIEDITRINGIEDKNKIYIGQQLYIPKFVRKNIAV